MPEVFTYLCLREGALDSYSKVLRSRPLADGADLSAATWGLLVTVAPERPLKDSED